MSTSSDFNLQTTTTAEGSQSDNEDGSGLEFAPKTFAEIFLASLKILIGIIGFLGNFTVCVVVAKMRSQRNYANSLIVSQAVTDLVTSLVLIATTFTEILPTPPPRNPAMGYLYCVFWYSRISMFCMFSISTFNLVAISLERYIAVLHPIWYSHHYSRKTAAIFATVAWLLAPLIQTIMGFSQFSFRKGRCVFLFPSRAAQAATGIIVFLWDFLVPCIIMAFCFTRISIKFQKQKKRVGASEMSTNVSSAPTQATTVSRANPGNGTEENTDGNAASESTQGQSAKKSGRGRNITKTLVIVFLVYVICWSPDQFLFLQWNLGGEIHFGGVLHSCVVIMAMLNSACNPFIYALRYKQYKQGLKSLFKCC